MLPMMVGVAACWTAGEGAPTPPVNHLGRQPTAPESDLRE